MRFPDSAWLNVIRIWQEARTSPREVQHLQKEPLQFQEKHVAVHMESDCKLTWKVLTLIGYRYAPERAASVVRALMRSASPIATSFTFSAILEVR